MVMVRRIAAIVCVVSAAGSVAAAAPDAKLAQSKKQAGDDLLKAGKTDDALAAYVAAIDADPGYLPAYDAAAPLWFGKQDFATPIARLTVVVQAQPTYAMGWYNLAFAYRKQKDYDKAVDAYLKFSALRPDEPDPYFGLGMTYKSMGKRPEAREAFKKYISLEKRADKQKFVDQAKNQLEALGDDTAAPADKDKPADKPVDKAPAANSARDIAVARKQAGDKKLAAGDKAGAEKDYRDAISNDQTYAAPHNELGALLYAQGKTADAIAEFELAVKLDPQDHLAWYNLARARRKAGDNKGAVEAYRAYIALQPDAPDAYYGMGQALIALGDTEGGKAALTKYIATEKRKEQQKFVAKAKQQLADLDKPVPATQPAATQPTVATTQPTATQPTATQPTVVVVDTTKPTPMPTPTTEQAAQARGYVEKGNRSFTAKRYEEAAGHYRGAVALDPTNVDARYRLGVALAAHGDLSGAISAWEGALLVDPKNDKARRNIELARRRLDDPKKHVPLDDVAILARARKLVDDGRYASAADVLDRLIADPMHAQNTTALSLRGEARLGKGDPAGAVVDWLTVLALAPGDLRSLRGLGDAYLALDDKVRARWYYETYASRAAEIPDEKTALAVVKHRLETL